MQQNINYCNNNKEKEIKFLCMHLDCKENRQICCFECAKVDHDDHLKQLNETNVFKQKLNQSREDCGRCVSTLKSQMEKIQKSFEKFCKRILERYSIGDGEFFSLKNEEIGQVIKDLDSFKGFEENLKANNIFESFNNKIDQYQLDKIDQYQLDKIDQHQQDKIDQHQQDKIDQYQQDKIDHHQQDKIDHHQQDKIDQHQQDKQENYGDISSVQQQNKTKSFILDNYVQPKFTGFSFQNEIFQINPQRTQLLIKDNKFNHFLFDHSQQITQIKMTQQFMQKYNMSQLLSKERGEEINKLQRQLEFVNQQMENMNKDSEDTQRQYFELYDKKKKIQDECERLQKLYSQSLDENSFLKEKLEKKGNNWIGQIIFGGLSILFGKYQFG